MGSMTFGAFREVYRGEGIYWAGKFNVEGSGAFSSIAEAKQAIDSWIAKREARRAQEQAAKAASGDYLLCRKLADGRVTIETPGGLLELASMREFRQRVFDIEETHGMETLWV